MRSVNLLVAFVVFGTAATSGDEKPAPNPTLKADDLDFLTGKWTGTLAYLDYSDNRTKQKLETALECTRDGDAVVYRFTYVEPNGKKVEGDKVKLTVHANGAEVRLNDEAWRVAGRGIDAANQKYEVVLTRDGSAGNKPAAFRRVITLSKGTLTIRTEEKAEKAEAALVRNEYTLKKK